MTITSKSYIIAWVVSVFIFVMLWYRNQEYDRVFASVMIMLGLIQLVGYASHSAVDPNAAGNIVVVLLVMSLLVFSISTYVYTKYDLILVISLIVGICLILLTGYILGWETEYMAYLDGPNGCPVWSNGEDSILGYFFIPYLIIIFLCWISLCRAEEYGDWTLYIVAILFITSGIYAFRRSDVNKIASSWSYLLVIIGLAVWIGGTMSNFRKSNTLNTLNS